MTQETTSFVYVTYIRSTPEKVFAAVTKPEILVRVEACMEMGCKYSPLFTVPTTPSAPKSLVCATPIDSRWSKLPGQ